MELIYSNITKKANELDGYYQKTQSIFLRQLIEDCIEKTLLAVQVYEQFSKDLNEILKGHIEIERNSFNNNLEYLKKIKANNDTLKELGTVDKKYIDSMDEFVVNNKTQYAELLFISAHIVFKITTEAIQMKGEQLFNEIFHVDISRFEKISVDNRNKSINDRIVKLIPILGKIFSEAKFIKEVYKTFDPKNAINEAIEKGDAIFQHIEDYNITLVKWLNHTIALGEALKSNQASFVAKINNSKS